MIKIKIPNTNKLTTAQVENIPIRLGDKPESSFLVGRCIRADDQYIYCEINPEVDSIISNHLTSIEFVKGELNND